MSYNIKFTKRAEKDLGSLSKEIRVKIIESLSILAVNPFSEIIQSKKLRTNKNLYRVRVGNYRVIYEIHGDTLVIIVIRIGHRKDVYKYLKF